MLLATEKEGTALTDNVQYVYDGLGRMTELWRKIGTSMHKVAAYDHDVNGNTTKVTFYDAATDTVRSFTEYKYDDFGRLVWVKSPDAGEIAYIYDANGLLAKQVTSDGHSLFFEYDAQGRLTAKRQDSATATPFQRFGFDEADTPSVTDCKTNASFSWPANRHTLARASSVADASGQRWFNYDAEGRLASALDQRAGATCARVTRYAYDATTKLLTNLTYPTGHELRYKYEGPDPRQVTSIEVYAGGNGWFTMVSDIRYLAGRLTRARFFNGTVNEYEWFLDGSPKLRRTRKSDGTEIYKREVTSTDPMGNPLTIAMLESGLGETFTYDSDFHTLITAQTGKTTHGPPYDGLSYTYEKTLLGDATQFLTNTIGGNTYQQNFTYESGSSRLDTYTMPQNQKFVFTHDPVGRLSGVDIYGWNDPNWTYAMGTTANYDADGNMTSILGASYVYDSRHLRTETVAALNAYTTHYYYDDAGHMLATHGCDDSTCTTPDRLFEYVWLGNEPMVIISTALAATGAPDDSNITGYALHNGLLGEPMRATGSSQAIVWWGDHEPYGERQPSSSSGTEPPIRLRLPGQVEDADGPFHYNWHRYYWPGIGRYVQADPQVYRAGDPQAPFQYARDVPASSTDATGTRVDVDPMMLPYIVNVRANWIGGQLYNALDLSPRDFYIVDELMAHDFGLTSDGKNPEGADHISVPGETGSPTGGRCDAHLGDQNPTIRIRIAGGLIDVNNFMGTFPGYTIYREDVLVHEMTHGVDIWVNGLEGRGRTWLERHAYQTEEQFRIDWLGMSSSTLLPKAFVPAYVWGPGDQPPWR